MSFFSGKLLQSIVPVKHGYTHFYTLSAIDEFYVLYCSRFRW